MTIRTDLVIEAGELNRSAFESADVRTYEEGGVRFTETTVRDDAAAVTGMNAGRYITCELPPLAAPFADEDERVEAIAKALGRLIPFEGCVLVSGLGNHDATPDALGPEACGHVIATRHIAGRELGIRGLEGLRSVCVLRPGVLGQTGIEVQELLRAAVSSVKAAGVIVVDALAARSIRRLGCTVQMSNSGISPGSGIGNRRAELTARTLGVPVIAVGVPTMVDASVLAHDLTGQEPDCPQGMIVTPRDIDQLIMRAGRLIGMSINTALQPTLSREELAALAN